MCEYPKTEVFDLDFIKQEITVEEGPDLKVHIKQEIDEKKLETVHKCDLCPSVLKTSNNLVGHKARVHNIGGKFPCGMCGQRFSTPTRLELHLVTHKGDKTLSTSTLRQAQEKPYKCEVCSAAFKTPVYLAKHKVTVHNIDSKFRCEDCGKGFMARAAFEEHLAVHRGQKTWTCDECRETFKEPNHLRYHKSSRHAAKPFHCELCPRKFTKPSYLERHHKKHREEGPLECEKCSENFKSPRNLARHRVRIHNIGGKFSCGTCGKNFMTLNLFQGHVALHESKNSFGCPECEKTFVTKNELHNHKRSDHPVLKSFRCELCFSDFARAFSLKQHYLMHSEEKLHECDECPKAYKTLSSLTKHKVTQHSAEGEFPCEECQRRFTLPSKLKQHQRWHTWVKSKSSGPKVETLDPKKPFQCELCHDHFSTVSSLKQHFLNHSERPKCDRCSKTFKTQTTLYNHKTVVHGEDRKFFCEKCEKTFVNGSQLKKHFKSQHNEKKFNCDRCGNSYALYRHLRLHKNYLHPNESFFQCKVCTKSFGAAFSLKLHSARHDRKKSFRVKRKSKLHVKEQPKEDEGEKSKLEQLLTRNTVQNYFKCDLCSMKFNVKANLDDHIKQAHVVFEEVYVKAEPLEEQKVLDEIKTEQV